MISNSLQVLAELKPADPGLRALPATVHFSGFTVGNTAEAKVIVRNVTAAAQRVYVQQPDPSTNDGRYFRVECQNAGRIAPGMSQPFTVSFSPDAYRYYYTAVRIVGETGEISVPVHAYPVATQFSFPSRVDFGRVALLTPVTKTVHLATGVPVPFHFSLAYLTPHPDFEVSPMAGTIPANGSLDVTITYRPASLSTAAATLQLTSSQYNAKPQVIELVGSSHPNMARDATLIRTLDASKRLQQTGPAALQQTAEGSSPGSSSGGEGEGEEQEGAGAGAADEEASAFAAAAEEIAAVEGGWAGPADDTAGGLSYATSRPSAAAAGKPPKPPLLNMTGVTGVTAGGGGAGAGVTRAGGKKVGMQRWLQRDPGLALLDDRLEQHKRAKEAELVAALQHRSEAVDVMAQSLRSATGLTVTREASINLLRATTNAESRTIDVYDKEAAGVGVRGRELTLIHGVRVPSRLTTQADINFVLMQQEGKLLPNDVKYAIAQKRAREMATSMAQARMRSFASAVHAEGFPAEGSATEAGYGYGSSSSRSRSTSPAKSRSPSRALQRRSRGGDGGSPVSPSASASASGAGSPSSPASPTRSYRTRSMSPGGSPTTSGRLRSPKALQRRTVSPPRDPAFELRRTARREKVMRGPGMNGQALSQATTASSWLYHAVQGLHTSELRHLLKALLTTPDFVQPGSGTLLDDTVSSAGGVLHGSVESLLPRGADPSAALPAALRNMVNAAEDSLVDPKQLRESMFTEEVNGIDRAEQMREFAQDGWKGEKLISQNGVHRVRMLRATLQIMEDAVRRRLQRTRRTTVSIPAGGLKALQAAQTEAVRSSVDAGSAVARGEEVPTGQEHLPGGIQTPQSLLSSPNLRSALLPLSKPIVPGAVLAPYAPSFTDPSGRDSWALRRDVFSRFKAAVTTHIVRTRVDGRIAMIISKLSSAAAHHSGIDMRAVTGKLDTAGALGQRVLEATRMAVADMVAREHRKAQIEGASSWVIQRAATKDVTSALPEAARAGGEGSEGEDASLAASPYIGEPARVAGGGLNVGDRLLFTITPERITRTAFAVAPVEDGPDQAAAWDLRQPLPVAVPTWSSEVAPFDIPQWPDELEAGYTPLPLPVAPVSYQPREDTRPLREGALHETAATGLLPLASAQVRHDPRLAAAAQSATRITLPLGGLGPASDPVRAAWPELLSPHPAVRHLPAGAVADAATGGSEMGPAEADPAYLLHPITALAHPVCTLPPDMHHDLLGVRHAHAAGNGVADPLPRLPGTLTLVRPGALPVSPQSAAAPAPPVVPPTAGGSGSAASTAFAGSGALDANGVLPTQSQVWSAQPGLSSIRAMQQGAGDAPPAAAPGAAATAVPQPLWLAHALLPSTTRPAPDLYLSLLSELPQPLLHESGRPRIPTDVTAADKRVYAASLLPLTTDPWQPSQLPSMLRGPLPGDALSDDSESDPEDSGKANKQPGGGGGGAASPRSVSPSSVGSGSGSGSGSGGGGKSRRVRGRVVPTMDTARSLFMPKSLRTNHARFKEGSVAASMTGSVHEGGGGGGGGGQLVSGIEARLAADRANPAQVKTPRDAAIVAQAAYHVKASDAATHWLEEVVVGRAAPGASIAGGVADPRQQPRMRPQ